MQQGFISVTEERVNKVVDWCWKGPHYPGMSYEDGVRAAIDWLVGQIDEAPDED